jgi:glycine/D-amino acid oxidase-like deaminating enzyme
MPATARRNLRTGTPVWAGRGGEVPPAGRLTRDLRVDVAIVGAGVTGALVADAVLQAGRTVVVVDRRGPAKGSTAASTALLQFEIDQPLSLLAEQIGLQRAARAWWRSASAVDALRGRIADLGIRCGWRERATVYLPGNVLNVRGLRAEAALRQRVGLRSRFIERPALRALTGVDGPGAIRSEGAGELNPVALVRGLWRSALARGASLHAPVDVVEVLPSRDRVALRTAAGPTIRARHAIFATGYETLEAARSRKHRVFSTWALATRPQPERLWGSRCLIWEAADPYLYVRTTPEGRVIAGGEDEEFSDEAARDARIPAKTAAIRGKLHALLPRLDTTPEFAWTGCFGATATGLPSIGPLPGLPRCVAVLGYGGNGITFSVVAAQLIQRALLKLPDPDRELFAF